MPASFAAASIKAVSISTARRPLGFIIDADTYLTEGAFGILDQQSAHLLSEWCAHGRRHATRSPGHVDGLAHNGGIFGAADSFGVTEVDCEAVLRVNVKGSFLVLHAVARAMAQASRGTMVNMSSVNGTLAIPNIASYNVSKGGINQLTRVMALALAPHNIRVNAVAPGTIATELAAKAVLTSDEAKNKILSRTPLGRLGEPSEIADVVAWLASDAASYVTGEIVTVDGGRMTLNYTVSV